MKVELRVVNIEALDLSFDRVGSLGTLEFIVVDFTCQAPSDESYRNLTNGLIVERGSEMAKQLNAARAIRRQLNEILANALDKLEVYHGNFTA